MKSFKLLLLAVIAFFQISFSQTGQDVNDIIASIQKKYAPDKRIAVFKIETETINGKLVVKGETDNKSALDELLTELRVRQPLVLENNVSVLPDSTVKGKNYAVVCISVANVRKDNDHDAEMVNQAILGTEVKLLKKKSGFYYVQTPDKYLGWIESGSLEKFDDASILEWRKAKKAIYTDLFGLIYSEKKKTSDQVMDVVIGSVVKFIKSEGAWWKVETPDGRTGYVPKEQITDKDKWDKTRKLTFDNVFKTAKRFLGFPYLWGGSSSKGVDCSGFVQSVFKLNGYQLPRDASQQVFIGEEIIPEKDYKNIKPGDLLFFGKKDKDGQPKATHVAIYIENYNYIHSASYVQISSLEKNAVNFDPYHSDRLVRITRIIK